MVFTPIRKEDLTREEIKRALESLIFLVEKRNGRIKARTCANGSPQREYTPREEAESPKASTEAILMTTVVDAKQKRDVRGPLADILVEMAPEVYADYVIIDYNGNKIMYVQMVKALYGVLQSSLLYYKQFRTDMVSIGFVVIPYESCVAKRRVEGSQQTVTWHVDNLKSSHVLKKVNDKFLKWLQEKYGGIVKVKAVRGFRHDYLAMFLDYSIPGVVMLDMLYYTKAMVEEFPEKLKKGVKCPWNDNLFKVGKVSKRLDDARAKTLPTFVKKGMFQCKRGRQDIQPAIAFLSTRVREPTEEDWAKLVRLISFLLFTKEDVIGGLMHRLLFTMTL